MIIKRAHESLERKVAALTTINLLLERQVKELKLKTDYVDNILQSTRSTFYDGGGSVKIFA